MLIADFMANIAEITAIPGTRFCTSLELEAMAERFPVEKTLGRLYEHIKYDELKPVYGIPLFRESPAGSPAAPKDFLGNCWFMQCKEKGGVAITHFKQADQSKKTVGWAIIYHGNRKQ